MSRIAGALVVSALIAAGCSQGGPHIGDRPSLDNLAPASPPPQTSAQPPQESPPPTVETFLPSSRPAKGMDQVVATVNKEPLTMEQFVKPLIEAHGLTMLLNLARLEIVKQQADKQKVVVTPQDIADERKTTLDKMFADAPAEQPLREKLEKAVADHDAATAQRMRDEIATQREEFLAQYRDEKHISQTEFDMAMEINTYLRKIAEPQIAGKITDEDIKNAFGQLYGEQARVRYIELNSMAEVREAQRRLAAGDRFEDVARDMSHNRVSAAAGGEMPPFTRATPTLPGTFLDVVFGLKKGQVSEPVGVGNSFLIVKLEDMLPPKAVKFEDVKESVRKTIYDQLLTNVIRELKSSLDQQVLAGMKIENPVLKQQFQAMIDKQIHDRKKINEEMERNRLETSAPTTMPTQPASRTLEPTTLPALNFPAVPSAAPTTSLSGDIRPPATQPGSAGNPKP